MADDDVHLSPRALARLERVTQPRVLASALGVAAIATVEMFLPSALVAVVKGNAEVVKAVDDRLRKQVTDAWTADPVDTLSLGVRRALAQALADTFDWYDTLAPLQQRVTARDDLPVLKALFGTWRRRFVAALDDLPDTTRLDALFPPQPGQAAWLQLVIEPQPGLQRPLWGTLYDQLLAPDAAGLLAPDQRDAVRHAVLADIADVFPGHFAAVLARKEHQPGWQALQKLFLDALVTEVWSLSMQVDGIGADVRQLHGAIAQFRDDVVAQLGGQPGGPFVWPEPFDSRDYEDERLTRFHGRSGVLRRVDAWLQAPRAPRGLLLLGRRGVGKTAFLAHLKARRADRVIASHFCRFDEVDRLVPGHIVRSLATQIGLRIPAYRARVAGDVRCRDALARAVADPARAWHTAVLEPLRQIGDHELPDAMPVPQLIVVDGLDESLELRRSPDSRTEPITLMELVDGAQDSRLPHWLRLIMGSRDVPRLGAARAAFAHIDLSAADIAAEGERDLREFIAGWVQGDAGRALLQDLAVDPDDFTGRLMAQCDGKFLVATLLMRDVEDRLLDAPAVQQFLGRSGTLRGMDRFYENSFRARVRNAGLEPAQCRDLLGLVTVAHVPLPFEALAAVLGGPRDDLQAVVDAMGGLLRHDTTAGGLTFEHFSIEQWLDPSGELGLDAHGMAKAGAFAIDRAASMARLTAHCRTLAAHDDPFARAGAFAPYLARRGVAHLLAAGGQDVDGALRLLVALLARADDAAGSRADQRARLELRVLEARLIDAIAKRLDAVDSAAAAPGDDPVDDDRGLASMAPRHLCNLLDVKDYETGKYGPVVRLLVQYHPRDWAAHLDSLLATRDDDIVFRSDAGVAWAQAWHASRGARRAALFDELADTVIGTAPGQPRREIAAYAVKHLCQRRHPVDGPWWHAERRRVQALVAALAESPSAVDRMVAGEVLLSLALQGEPVMAWLPGSPFWTPVWPNLRADVHAIQVLDAVAAGRALDTLPPHDGMADCIAQHRHAEVLRERVRRSPLLRRTAPLARLADAVASGAAQQADLVLLRDLVDPIGDVLDAGGPPRGQVLDLLRLLALHPLWSETERVANTVAMLLKTQRPSHPREWVVESLASAPSAMWRLRYCALDAAYTAGVVDGYALFRRLLATIGDDPHCRVRGIAADDLDALLAEAPDLRDDPDVQVLLRTWLRTANDAWLLEYLHRIVTGIRCGPDGDAAVVALMPPDLSRFLAPDASGRPFHDCDADTFLALIEDRARADPPTGP